MCVRQSAKLSINRIAIGFKEIKVVSFIFEIFHVFIVRQHNICIHCFLPCVNIIFTACSSSPSDQYLSEIKEESAPGP